MLRILGSIITYNFYKRKYLKANNNALLSENKRLKLEQRSRQLQLNPHFIYNAIANLQSLIYHDDKKVATTYIQNFSTLMRQLLALNQEEFITLEAEISLIENYLKLQQLRYDHSFNFEIIVDNVPIENVLIPPMLLQPFIENAIEYGFRNIDYTGKLLIKIDAYKEQLIIEIKDNGKASNTTYNATKKSISTQLIEERLALLYQAEHQHYSLQRGTLAPPQNGYEVKLSIPLQYD